MADIDSLTDEQLQQVALGNITLSEALEKKPYYTADNIDELSDEQLAMVASGTPLSEIQKERNEFIGMGSSIGGALGGAAIGTAILPGLGTVAGGIIGGAIGAFGGELAEDYVSEQDLNYINAAKEAAISVGIDLVTLGVGSKVKSGYFAAKRAMGFAPNETAEEVVNYLARNSEQVGATGSAAEAAAANRILSEGGGGITAAQLPNANAFTRFADNIGRIGITSQQEFAERHAKNNQAVINTVDEMIEGAEATPLSAPELGQSILEVFKLGKANSTAMYGRQLEEVATQMATDMVSAKPVYDTVQSILTKKALPTTGETALEKPALGILTEMSESLGRLMPKSKGKDAILNKTIYSRETPIPAYELLRWEKKYNGILGSMLDKNSKHYAPQSHQQLVEAFSQITPAIKEVLYKANPKAATRYDRINKVYAATRTNLDPKAVQTLIGKAATREEYNELGKVFLPDSGINPDKAKQLWSSINFAVKRLSKAEMAEKGFTNADDIIKTIKASYLSRVLPDYKAEGFDIVGVAKKVANMKPESLDVARKVFTREEFSRFNALRGAIRMASKAKSTDMFSLAFRSKEISSISSVVGAAGIGGVSAYSAGVDPVTGGLGGLAFLFAPKVLAKIALSPRRTEKFIKIMSRNTGTPQGLSATQKQAALLIAELSDASLDLD